MSKKLVLLLLILIVQGTLLAQGQKFGYVEDQRILKDLPAVKEVQKILDKESAIWEKQFSNRQQEVKTFLDSVTTAEGQMLKASQDLAAGVASPDSAVTIDTVALRAELKRLSGRSELAKKELVAFYHKIYGDDGTLKRRNAELSQSVLERVNQVIADKGKQLGYTMIFDSSLLLYVNQENNITEQVMEALNIQQEQRAR